MFGIGAGKAELKLPETVYAPGQAIKGKLLLTLSGPINADGVTVKLYAEQTFRESAPKGRTNTVTRRIYELPVTLDGKKEYPKTAEPLSYDFKLVVPENAKQIGAPSGSVISIGPITLSSNRGPTGPPKWFVEGQLDIPMAFDIKARTQIIV